MIKIKQGEKISSIKFGIVETRMLNELTKLLEQNQSEVVRRAIVYFYEHSELKKKII